MPLSELMPLLVFCTAMSFSPGPNTTLSTALASNHGLRRALRFCLAVPAGWTLLLLACAAGVGAMVAEMPPLRWGVQLAGLAYLLHLAWKLWGARGLNEADPRQLDIGFLGGVLLQFLNIKAWMLALTLTAGWIVQSQGQPTPNPGERLLLVIGLMLGFAFFSNFSYALVGSLLRGWLTQGRRLVWFNRSLALVLLATAFWMLGL